MTNYFVTKPGRVMGTDNVDVETFTTFVDEGNYPELAKQLSGDDVPEHNFMRKVEGYAEERGVDSVQIIPSDHEAWKDISEILKGTAMEGAEIISIVKLYGIAGAALHVRK